MEKLAIKNALFLIFLIGIVAVPLYMLTIFPIWFVGLLGVFVLGGIVIFYTAISSMRASKKEGISDKDRIPSDDSRHIPSEVKRIVWERDGGKCVICGSRRHLEYDHDIPVSQGGSNTDNNIRILCRHCNRRKSGRIE